MSENAFGEEEREYLREQFKKMTRVDAAMIVLLAGKYPAEVQQLLLDVFKSAERKR